MSKPLLEISNLTAGYGKLAIVQQVDMDVGQGRILALIGPNGSGKSTLIKSIMGNSTVLNGSISFRGMDITHMPPHEVIRLGISYVPQTENLFEGLSIQDNLELGAYIIDDNLTVRKNLEEVFQLFPILEERRRQKAKTLSGGERQLLAIARGLMSKPIFLMLDEPTASVAPALVAQIFNKICEIRDSGVTMIIVEQNVKKALQISDYVTVLVAGRLAFTGNTKEVIDHKELADVFLGKKVY